MAHRKNPAAVALAKRKLITMTAVERDSKLPEKAAWWGGGPTRSSGRWQAATFRISCGLVFELSSDADWLNCTKKGVSNILGV